MTMLSTLRTIAAFLRGKTISNRGCDISRADAARIVNIGVYS